MSARHETIVVTGGSTGIGASICQHLLDQGHGVVNLARRPSAITHPRLSNRLVDLSDRSETAAVAAAVAAEHSVTGLVHNAGLIRPALLPEVRLEDVDYLAEVHLGAAISLTQAFSAGHAAAALRSHQPDYIARCAGPADAHRLFGDQGGDDGHGAYLGAGTR